MPHRKVYKFGKSDCDMGFGRRNTNSRNFYGLKLGSFELGARFPRIRDTTTSSQLTPVREQIKRGMNRASAPKPTKGRNLPKRSSMQKPMVKSKTGSIKRDFRRRR